MDRRIKKTRLAIRQAYKSLFLEKPNGKISIAELARRANIDRKTFYLHYSTTDEVLTEFLRERMAGLSDLLQNSTSMDSHPFYASALFQMLDESILDDLELFQQISRGPNRSFFWQCVHDIFYEAILRAVKSHTDKPEKQLQYYTEYFTTGILSMYRRWLTDPDGITIEELGRMASAISMEGILAVFPEYTGQEQRPAEQK
jgi:AcrR family transcriptional regulator